MATLLRVPVYRREDWPRIKSLSADDIPGTYDDYSCELKRRLATYKEPNEVVIEVEVDYDDMLEFLRINSLENVADNRMLYIQAISGTPMKERRR
jgi:hypothetical protein